MAQHASHHEPRNPARHGSRRITHKMLHYLIAVLLLWIVAAYLLLPWLWKHYERRHAPIEDNPRVTTTSDGHPGDPLNVALVGTEDQLQAIMQAAGWHPAAALGLRSDLKIAVDSVLKRSDDEAPVSNLYLFGRKEDLAFEKAVGGSPRQRHHVRFWLSGEVDDDQRPRWLGSASFDRAVGLSHTTGQLTHHIAADVDAERDFLMSELRATGRLANESTVAEFHKVREGRNGGGDRWYTDGKLLVGVIEPNEE